jgi:D-3-phosphoglycerate dehydrogenase
MNDTIEPLIADLVTWVAKEERGYLETMEAWRTSCPRLPVWEEANSRGLVTRALNGERMPIVAATDAGRRFLKSRAQG